MDFIKFIEWLKLSAQHLFWLFLFSSIILSLLSFGSDEFLETLGFRDFRSEYRMVIGLLWILSSSGLVVTGAKWVFAWIWAEITSRRRMKRLQERLHQLTLPEHAILRKYIMEGTQTQDLSLHDGVAQGLVVKEILYHPPNTMRYWDRGIRAHNMRPWAWDYLKKHPELLKD
jgi:hypothetical protein